MTTNPLPANATLVFQVPSSNPGTDRLGNPTQDILEVTANCYLKRANRSIAPDSEPGTRGDSIYVEGYLISISTQQPGESAVLPPGIVPGSRAAATFAGEWQTTGDFFLDTDTPSPFPLVDQILGQRIRGTLYKTTAMT